MASAEAQELKAIAAGLAKAPLFSELSGRQVKQLAKFAKVRDIAKDTPVVKQGEKGIGFYLVLQGQFVVRRSGRSIAKLGPGDFFGELALFDDRVRSADVIASEPCRVVVLSRWEFWGFAADRPEILKTILSEMARRLDEKAPGAPAP